jgi:hypothetical protein
LFSSPVRQWLRYRRERFPAAVFVPLAVFLWTAGLASGLPVSARGFAVEFALACGLLFQFRLWDDLADLPGDRREYPDRLLCRAPSLAAFYFLLATALAVNAAFIALLRPVSVLALFGLFNAAFLLWYGCLRDLVSWPAVGCHVVLLKYPAFVYLLSPPPSAGAAGPLAWAMALVYLCFAVHEVIHDPRLRTARWSTGLLAVEMAAMTAAALFLLGPFNNRAIPGLRGALGLVGAAVLASLLKLHRDRLEPGPWRYGVFLVGFSWLLNSGVSS